MTLVIDNYDSFLFNLVQILAARGEAVRVERNDTIDGNGLRALKPGRVLIGPGPGGPDGAGISCEAVRVFGPQVPLLGVCLGHQCIGAVYGARIVPAQRLLHGKTSRILHRGGGVFDGMENPFEATRYHSLIIERGSLPACLQVNAETEEGEIMGIRHVAHPVHGVQFHPESVLTRNGERILDAFLNL